MSINEELREIEAIHAAFDDLVSHGKPAGPNHVTVSIDRLVKLQKRIDRLYGDLRDAWDVTHPDTDAAPTP